MAEKLSAERAGGNVTRASFLEFVEKHEAIEEELAEHQETGRSIRRRRKDLRKIITASGIVLAEFDRHLVDEKRSGEEREAAEHAYRQYMAWRGKPIGFRGKLDLVSDSPADALAFEQREVRRADRDGFKAGKTGGRADSNPWRPGSEPFAAWHSSWFRGQAEKVTTEIRPADAPKRGRPRSPERIAREAAAATVNGATPGTNTAARAQGREDGLAGHRDHAARWPQDNGAADYALGHAEGERERHLPVAAAAGEDSGMDETTAE